MMTNLYDLITGNNNDAPSGNRFFNLLTGKNNNYLRENMPEEDVKPQIEPMQYDNNGNIDYEQTLELRQNTTPRSIGEHLFGRNMTLDKQIVNPETGNAEIETINNFRPGFFNNLDKGVQENFRQSFTPQNWQPEKKALGERIGEGLGSLARTLGGWGGDAWIAGQYGLDKAMKRQSIRTNNDFYRNALEQQGVNTSNINGFINGEMYKNASLNNYRTNRLNMQQSIASAKDNTTRANMILKGFENGMLTEDEALAQLQYYGIDISELQPSNKTRNVQIKEDLLPHQINNLDAKTNAIYTNARNNTYKTNAYVDYLHGRGKGASMPGISKNNQGSLVRVQAPDGNVRLIPQSQVNAALQAGGKLL